MQGLGFRAKGSVNLQPVLEELRRAACPAQVAAPLP